MFLKYQVPKAFTKDNPRNIPLKQANTATKDFLDPAVRSWMR
ncbi:hypothetical protein OK016_29935 [Vibrio chagasii]|nr:hypothetical protein [Vibrio chagasii]